MFNLKTGSTLHGGKYIIEKVLGQGGFGITYLASQPMLNRKVAIKEFFYKEFCNRDESNNTISVISKGGEDTVKKFRAKFLKEARTIASLKHANIIEVYDVFEENGTAYYVMEFVEGETLTDLVKQNGKLDENTALSYIQKVASALSYIHQKHINHLDIKPSNIMLRNRDNEVIVIDFGMAKHYDVKTGDGTTTTPIGISPGFAPLEQYRQGGVSSFTPESDIYSLGATLYKLVTGETPMEASALLEEGGIQKVDGVSSNTSNAIVAAMQTSKSKRPKTVQAFLDILKITSTSPKTSVKIEKEESQEQKAQYSDYDWPEDNSGWFVAATSLNGRWRRREFVAVAIPVSFLALIGNLFTILAFCVITIAVSGKRLHDMNLSSKYCFVLIASWILSYFILTRIGAEIAVIVSIIQLLWYLILGLYPGSKGINGYGSNPRRDYEEQCVEVGFPKLSECK